MSEHDNQALIVSRDDLRQCKIISAALAEPAVGEALLKIETFGLSSNNITYLALGDVLPYRDIFPVPSETAAKDWCSAPVWGVARVLESKSPHVEKDDRVYGLFPASRFVTLDPTEPTPGGFRVERPHVPAQLAFYQQYGVLGRDPFFLPGQEELMAVMRPLFLTGLLLDDYFRETRFAGAERVVVSSAASKTAFGFAFAFQRSGGAELVGLCSARSRDSASRFGLYDRMVVYEEIDNLTTDPSTAYVDISGSAAIRKRLEDQLGDALQLSISVGLTHWADGNYGGSQDQLAARSETFFAPGWFARRVKQEGQAFFGQLLSGWSAQVTGADRHFAVARESGANALVESFLSLVDGRADPDRALVHDL